MSGNRKFTRKEQIFADDKDEVLFKILVIGDFSAGKTSFIRRYVHQYFSSNYRATIGVDFALKVINWDANTVIRLQLWDISGQERLGNMTRVYYKDAVGAFIVFDLNSKKTFDCVKRWKNDLDEKVLLPDGSKVPCVLLANKCDLEAEPPMDSPQFLSQYCQDNNYAGWYYTSPKENINIEEAARFLVQTVIESTPKTQTPVNDFGDIITVNHVPHKKSNQSKCKC